MASDKFGKLADSLRKKLSFGKRKDEDGDYSDEPAMDETAQDDYEDEYVDADDRQRNSERDRYTASGYSGRFADNAASQSDDDYDGDDDDESYPDDYDDYDDYDDPSDDGDYDEDSYDDDFDDDGTSDAQYRDDGEDSFNDRYGSEDAQADSGDRYGEESGFMRFVEENDWVNYALLLLLPPLGIYLLWRRRKFEKPLRYAVSALSALWFVIALILIFSLVFSSSPDTKTIDKGLTISTTIPTASVAPVETKAPVTGAAATKQGTAASKLEDLKADATPVATAIPSGAQSGVSAGTVYVTATGMYYHNNVACPEIDDPSALSSMTTDAAMQLSKNPCPICYPNQVKYYATENGAHYHADATCSGMKGATVITAEAAKEKGKTPCPVCITKELNSLAATELKFADANTKDKSGITVWCTKSGKYYHLKSNCDGMRGAISGSLLQAIVGGKRACPKCCKGAETQYYCTKKGTYYHNNATCSGMKDAVKVMRAEALILGKKACSVCLGSNKDAADKLAASNGKAADGSIYVYGTKGGKYYHTQPNCSGMKNAEKVSIKSMIDAGKTACPVCCNGANSTVYCTSGGTYYHANPDCSGMKNAKPTTQAEALAKGYKKCTVCWPNGGGTAGDADSGFVYCTKKGTYYHTKSNCSGMKNAERVSLASALQAGKTACPTCASSAKRIVYSTKNGTYYHSKKDCSGMKNAESRTLESAIAMGQKACPKCITSSAMPQGVEATVSFKKGTPKTALSSSAAKSLSKSGLTGKAKTASFRKAAAAKTTLSVSQVTLKKTVAQKLSAKAAKSGVYKAGKSGVKVYATPGGKYYHTYKSCAGAGSTRITLETALNYGKKACPKCASSGGKKVYATRNGKYYHSNKICAGAGAVKGSLSKALAMGKDPCPICIGKKAKSVKPEQVYKPGKSGIKVYASITGKYYHAYKSCAGSSASRVSLETALNYKKKACPRCSSAAKKTVYAVPGKKYYHISKVCAGTGAVSGSYANARASGLKECPICIGGSEAFELSDKKYAAAADTAVYLNPVSESLYYHRKSRCAAAGMSKGQKVPLVYALSWKYKACPYCNPPTKVK